MSQLAFCSAMLARIRIAICHAIRINAGMSRALFLALASFLVVVSVTANAFTVINTNDTGAGSLRQAITDANNQAGLDTIEFTIPGAGVHTITPATQLPSIISPVIIDGYSQPGSSANTLATGENAVLLIEDQWCDLGNNGNALVLEPGANGSTIKGLVINHGWSTAIFVDTDSVVIEGCFWVPTPRAWLAGQHSGRECQLWGCDIQPARGRNDGCSA